MGSSTYTIPLIYEAHCKTLWPVFEYRLCKTKRLNALSVFCLKRALIADKEGDLRESQYVPSPADFLHSAMIYLCPGNEAGSISLWYSSKFSPKWLKRWRTCYDEGAQGSERPTAAQGPETRPRGAIFRLDKWSEGQKSSSRRTAKVLDTLGPITPRPEHLLWLLVYPKVLRRMAIAKLERDMAEPEHRPAYDRRLITLNSFKATSERMLLTLKITHEAIAKIQEPYETYEKNRAQRKPSPVSTGGPAPPMRGNNRNTQGNAGGSSRSERRASGDR